MSCSPATATHRRQSTGSLQAPRFSSRPVHTFKLKINALHCDEMNNVGSVPFSSSKSSIELINETPSSTGSAGDGAKPIPRLAHSSNECRGRCHDLVGGVRQSGDGF